MLLCLRLKTRQNYILSILTFCLVTAFLVVMVVFNQRGDNSTRLNSIVEPVVVEVPPATALATPKWGFEQVNQLRLQTVGNTCATAYDTAEERFSQDWIQTVREQYSAYSETLWNHLHVNERNKLVFCHNPKAASTTFLRYLMKLSDPGLGNDYVNTLQVHSLVSTKYLTRFINYTKADAAKIMTTYKKITWVRNPLERVVSAWKDKLYSKNSYFNKLFGSTIILKFRPNATADEIQTGYPVTLEEFFRYLLLRPKPTRTFDRHWRPMYEVCSVCAIHYDFIGHVENFKEEVEYFAKKYTTLPFVPDLPYSPPRYTDKYADLRQVPKELTERVLQIYKLDYDFFGYNMTADLEAIYKNYGNH